MIIYYNKELDSFVAVQGDRIGICKSSVEYTLFNFLAEKETSFLADKEGYLSALIDSPYVNKKRREISGKARMEAMKNCLDSLNK